MSGIEQLSGKGAEPLEIAGWTPLAASPHAETKLHAAAKMVALVPV